MFVFERERERDNRADDNKTQTTHQLPNDHYNPHSPITNTYAGRIIGGFDRAEWIKGIMVGNQTLFHSHPFLHESNANKRHTPKMAILISHFVVSNSLYLIFVMFNVLVV